MVDLANCLREVVAREGSDLHLHAGNSALGRVDGRLRPLDPDAPKLTAEDTEQLLHEILPTSRITEFEKENELDFAYSIPGFARFRVNAFRQRGSVTVVMRALPFKIPSIEELGLPEPVTRLAEEERGVVLVTGTTGSGKSTTLAAMVEHVNQTMEKHIVTIEDPIEYLHADARSEVNQREIGADTESFSRALRRVLRQDPDVILIGEMRDEETVRTALSAAETGHLVFSTLHTADATETVNRVLDFFPQHEQQHARAMLAGTLKGVISQRLVPAAGGNGRVPICEVMRMTGRVHDMITDPDQTEQIPAVIAEGEFYGMQTFDQALRVAVDQGTVDMDVALRYATHPHDFKLLVAAEGRLHTSIEDVPVAEPPVPAW